MVTFSSVLRMLAALAFVLGGIVLLAYLAKRFYGSRLGLSGRGPLLRVVSIARLGTNREVAVIEVGGAFLVIGVTANQITLLTRLDALPYDMPSEVKQDT